MALIIIFHLVIYLPHVGTGFVKDDFVWLENSLSDNVTDYLKPFVETTGFYRPLVNLSFGLQFEWFEINSKPYGIFNLFLHILNIIMVYLLFSSFKTFKPYALLVTFLFAMSIKSSTMAVGWISGRTTLMFVFFSLLSLYLYLKRKQAFFFKGSKLKIVLLYILVGCSYLAGLMSKESAVAFPLFVILINFWGQKKEKEVNNTFFLQLLSNVKQFFNAILSTSVYILPLVVYFFFRLKSNAFTPFNTPEYYRYTLDPLALLNNLVEYISRSLVFDFFLLICLIFLILVLKKKNYIAQNLNKNILKFGILWFLCFILPMLPLVVRSDIYVYLPQIGLHLIFAVLILPLWKALIAENKSRKLKHALFLPVLALLIVWLGYFWIRASAYGKDGMSSTQFSWEILKASAEIKENNCIIIVDLDENTRFSPLNSVAYGFNSLLRVYFPQKKVSGEIISPAQFSDMKCDNKVIKIFFYKKNIIIGPFKCWELRNLFSSLSPQFIKLQNISKKQRKINRYKQKR